MRDARRLGESRLLRVRSEAEGKTEEGSGRMGGVAGTSGGRRRLEEHQT